MNSFFKIIIALIAFLQVIEVTTLIIKRCGTGLYGIMSSVLFIVVCVIILYIFLSRWV